MKSCTELTPTPSVLWDEVWVFNTDLPEQAEQHVGVQRALVCFVHDDGAVVVQIRLTQRLTQQDPISHVLNYGLLRSAVLEADGVTNLLGSERYKVRERKKKKERNSAAHQHQLNL